MKKWIGLCLAVSLTVGMAVSAFGGSGKFTELDTSKMTPRELEQYEAYAEAEKRAAELPMDEPQISDILKEELGKENYAGSYAGEDRMVHIIPLEGKVELAEEKLAEIVARSEKPSNVIFDEPMKYSQQELADALERLTEKLFELDLRTIKLDDNENTLIVSAMEWPEEKKQKVQEVTGLDNLIFETLTEEPRWGNEPYFAPLTPLDSTRQPRVWHRV